MSLDKAQQEWFDGYLARQRDEAKELPQEPKTKDKESTADPEFQKRVKEYKDKVQSLASNPVVFVDIGVRKQMAADAIPDADADDTTKALYKKKVDKAINGMLNTAKDGAPLQWEGIVQVPKVDMETVTGVISNPSSILSLLNPLSLIAPIGNILDKIPIVHQLKTAMGEALTGLASNEKFDFGKAWDRAGVRVSLEEAFAGLPEKERPAVIDKAMADYQKPRGKTPLAPAKTASVVFSGASPGMIVPTPTTTPASHPPVTRAQNSPTP